MAYKIVLQPRAEADIAEAHLYILERAPEAAARWYQGIKAAIQSLAKMPARCSGAPESEQLQHGLKQLHYGKRMGTYRIVFRIVEDRQEVHILTIRHAARKSLEIDDLK